MPEADPRFGQAIELFNSQEWYAAHDVFEELWHETADPERRSLQGILQVAVAQLHLCLLYTSPSPRDLSTSRMPSSA